MTNDGTLDEPEWAEAELGSGFVERVPVPGATPPVRTEVRVLVQQSSLFVAVTSYLPLGEKPRGLELRRDSFGIFSDDAASLKFDVRHDARTTTGFVTNPAGTQMDYLAVENGDEFRREFDAIWRVAARVHEDRWVAEFEIPAVALGLPSTKGDELHDVVVGMNVSRDHNARLATYDWSPIPPEFGPTSALFYGDLLGLERLAGGQPISIIPYLLGGYESFSDPEFRGRGGGEVRLRLAEDVWTELTILTDFAQVDLDDPVVNLDRFALFFPERRPFFLSGVEFFEFGLGGEAQLYFSRRIGLDENGVAIPVLGGIKGYGTVGDFRLGVLDAVTDGSGEQPGQSFTVVRGRHNFGEDGHIGMIGTLRTNADFLSAGHPPVGAQMSLGVDGGIRGFSRRLEVTAFAAMTTEPGGEGGGFSNPEGLAGQATVLWGGDRLQPRIELLVLSPDFDPAVGFVRRPGQLTPSVFLPWITRTQELGLQEITVEAGGSVVRSYAGEEVLTQSGSLELDLLFRSGFGLNLYAEAREFRTGRHRSGRFFDRSGALPRRGSIRRGADPGRSKSIHAAGVQEKLRLLWGRRGQCRCGFGSEAWSPLSRVLGRHLDLHRPS